MTLWPCKYPLATDKNGITSIANEIHLITNATSSIVFPPLSSPIISKAICLANTNKTINEIIAINLTKVLPKL